MEKKKQFTAEEKAAFINDYLIKQKNDEFNEQEAVKEKRFKAYLIIAECGVIIGLLFFTNFIWSFDWLVDINSWITNVFVPIFIFNLVNSIWLIIEKKVKRIKLWVRIMFFFTSLVVTFFVSASLRLEFDNINAFSLIVGIICGLLSIGLFLTSLFIARKEAHHNSDYQIAIMSEIIDDINENKNESESKK